MNNKLIQFDNYIVALTSYKYNENFEKYLKQNNITYVFLSKLQLYIVKATKEDIENIKKLSFVSESIIDIDIKVNLDSAVTPSISPPQLGREYCNKGIEKINAPRLWSKKINGNNINVAIIDSGIGPHYALNISKYQVNYVSDEDFKDANGHGTLIAGIIGARQFRPNNYSCTNSGVAYNCNLLNVKIFNKDGLGKFTGLISAINWCIENRANVAVLGFSFDKNLEYNYTSLLSFAIQTASEKIIFVGSTGNKGDNKLLQPASISPVIACGSVTESNSYPFFIKSCFSNYGKSIKFVAPGEYIFSTYPKNTYMYASSTSMAAAHLAGLIALLLSRYPNSKQVDIMQMLIAKSIPYLPYPYINPFSLVPCKQNTFNIMYGYGLIQA